MQSQKKKIKGKIKWFNPEKGYGFITSLDGKDYFFPKSALTGKDIDLSVVGENDLVIFSGQAAKKGPRASDVNIVESAPSVNKRTDDRIVCPSCGRKIVPRMIFEHRKPSYSVCSFCGKTVRRFQSPIYASIPAIIFIILVFAMITSARF